MTAILGISAFYHDSAAALVVDGEIVAAAQEERFTRRKHEAGWPTHAIDYCLHKAGLTAVELEYVTFYEKPLIKFDRLLETWLAVAPAGFSSFRHGLLALREKVNVRRTLRRKLPDARQAKLVFLSHHESHAASAFLPSPFRSAAILTLDGVGEWTTAALGRGAENQIELTSHMQFPHSLGLLYSAFTYYCGFKVNSGEHKLMGLAPLGRPIYRDAIYEHIVDLKPDGSFWLDMRYFNFCRGLTMTNRHFARLFGGEPRVAESVLQQRHADLAASVQAVTEEIILRMARHLHTQTGEENLVLAGGVALNCVAVGRLRREGPFRGIWIQPAAGDAGGALGAALFVWHQLLGRPRMVNTHDSQRGSLLGPQFSCTEIEQVLAQTQTTSRHFDDEAELLDHVAGLLIEGKTLGWFQGRMEFGPRALGARSILADPRSPTMQAKLNDEIKFRESFRPFAPAVLLEHATEWFDFPSADESPYMLATAAVQERQRRTLTSEEQGVMHFSGNFARRVGVARSSIPAVTHVDYSARIQTVDEERHGRFYRLLKAFHARTGCPVLVNTSFNVRGEPIVCTPQDALRCFEATGLFGLVLENHVIYKEDLRQTRAASPGELVAACNGRDAMNGPSFCFHLPVKTLRQFAAILIVLLVSLGGWEIVSQGSTWKSAALLAAGAAIGLVAIVWPALVGWLFAAAALVTFPIGWLVSQVMVAIAYFGLFTPAAIGFRLLGRDALGRKRRPEEMTYWQPSPPLTDLRRYFQQF